MPLRVHAGNMIGTRSSLSLQSHWMPTCAQPSVNGSHTAATTVKPCTHRWEEGWNSTPSSPSSLHLHFHYPAPAADKKTEVGPNPLVFTPDQVRRQCDITGERLSLPDPRYRLLIWWALDSVCLHLPSYSSGLHREELPTVKSEVQLLINWHLPAALTQIMPGTGVECLERAMWQNREVWPLV